MNRRRNFWKRADIRLRMSCRKLTERQRAAVLLALFLPFLAGCVYTIGTALQGFGERDGPGRRWSTSAPSASHTESKK